MRCPQVPIFIEQTTQKDMDTNNNFRPVFPRHATSNGLRSIVWILATALLSLASCSSRNDNEESSKIEALADKVWAFSQSHPDGFTLDLRTMTEPAEGIAVSYSATHGSHSRSHLDTVVRHALSHEGYVGGWLNSADGLYYFDSTRLFAEDSLQAALQFGHDNDQNSVFILSNSTDVPLDGKVAEIVQRQCLKVGTTGDYRPLSYREPSTGEYWGFGIEMAQAIAHRMGVSVAFSPTSWPTLSADATAAPQAFDFAIGGITITDARKATMLMSDGYLGNGKTILCRRDDAEHFRSLSDIDRPEGRVMVNPGGLNEKFAREHLTHSTLIVHDRNEEIPSKIAEGAADIMITEITEAPYYVKTDSSNSPSHVARLAC